MTIVYVQTVGFDLQNDVFEGDHKLFKSENARRVREK